MKILWFSNTPALGEEYISKNSIGGGWLKSLDKALQEKIELHVAFYHPRISESFIYKKTHYYPIKREGFYKKIIRDFFYNEIIDQQDLHIYTDIIQKVNPDLIHIHGTENPFGCLINEVKIPILVSIQGIVTPISHKFLSGIEKKYLFTNPTIDKLFLSGIFPFLRTYKSLREKALIEQSNISECKYILGRTDWDRRVSKLLAPKSSYFHEDRVLRDTFYQKVWMSKNNARCIIHTTNANSFYKGFETICQAVNILNKSRIDFEWRVAGISSNDLIVKVVKKKLGKAFPHKNLLLFGSLNETKLVDALLDADIYVMSSHIENNSNNLYEAMMLGMPCIATFAGGTGSLLHDKNEGLLIQDGDPWAMAGAVVELINDSDTAINYGRKARERALLRHDRERIINDVFLIYQNVLNDNK